MGPPEAIEAGENLPPGRLSTPAAALVFLVAFGLAFGVLWRFAAPGSAPDPGPARIVELIPSFGPLPEFRLVEASGDALTEAHLAGKVWVASFIFTSCAGTCPVISSRNQALQALLPPAVRLVSISVDPEKDTPEVLRAYGQRYGRDPARWLLATGDPRQVYELMNKGFHLQGNDPLAHSNGFALVDGAGMLRGFYEAMQEEEMNRLVGDVGRLLAEEQG